MGGYQYNNDVLQFFSHAQGYVKHTVNPSNGASEFDYVYQYKDHLGNIRINYTFDTATSSLRVLEENHYYPFGLKHQENLQPRSIRFAPSTIESNEWIKGVGYLEPMPVAALVPNSGYQNKYNGKSWENELGLDMYDMDMRQYDPAIARWVVQDPVIHHSMSPYNAFDNNPVYWADPSGADVVYNWDTGKYMDGNKEVSFQDALASYNDDIIKLNKNNEVTEVVSKPGDNVVYQDGNKLTNLDEATKKATGIKIGDKIVGGELFRLLKGALILRADIKVNKIDIFNKNHDIDYGHWWVEFGAESYGWWPKYQVGFSDTFSGVEGELNGQTTYRGGTPTRDPYHRERIGVNVFNLYTRNANSTTGIISGIRDFANNYSGSWSWPFGQNCHSFQEAFIRKFNLTINPDFTKGMEYINLK